MTAMTIERAVDNAIVSTEMEGFVITEKHRELIIKLMNKEITLEEALNELGNKNNCLCHTTLISQTPTANSHRLIDFIM